MKFTKLASATLLSLAAVSVSQAVTLDIEITHVYHLKPHKNLYKTKSNHL